jgi:phosphosulfolactate phosphohydrolase-like enzyme
VRSARKGLRKVVLNDSADVALGLAQRYRSWVDAFTSSDAGRALQALGMEQDVQFCAAVDKYDLVPTYTDRLIT